MFNFFRKEPQEPPRLSGTSAPGGNLTDDEIARLRLSCSFHIRMLESGQQLQPGADARFALEASLVMVEILAKIHDEMKGLREDVALLNPHNQFAAQLGWTSGKSQGEPSLSPQARTSSVLQPDGEAPGPLNVRPLRPFPGPL